MYLYRNLTVSRTGDFFHHTVVFILFVITTYIVNKTFIGVNLIGKLPNFEGRNKNLA